MLLVPQIMSTDRLQERCSFLPDYMLSSSIDFLFERTLVLFFYASSLVVVGIRKLLIPSIYVSSQYSCAESPAWQGRHLNVYRDSVGNENLDGQTENNDRPVPYMTIQQLY